MRWKGRFLVGLLNICAQENKYNKINSKTLLNLFPSGFNFFRKQNNGRLHHTRTSTQFNIRPQWKTLLTNLLMNQNPLESLCTTTHTIKRTLWQNGTQWWHQLTWYGQTMSASKFPLDGLCNWLTVCMLKHNKVKHGWRHRDQLRASRVTHSNWIWFPQT